MSVYSVNEKNKNNQVNDAFKKIINVLKNPLTDDAIIFFLRVSHYLVGHFYQNLEPHCLLTAIE